MKMGKNRIKLDLVAECFAGLTHGFWQHENRNNH